MTTFAEFLSWFFPRWLVMTGGFVAVVSMLGYLTGDNYSLIEGLLGLILAAIAWSGIQIADAIEKLRNEVPRS